MVKGGQMSSIQYLKFCWAMWVGAIIFMVALMLFLHCFPFVFMFVMLAFCCSSLYVLPFFLSLLSFLFNCVPFYLCVCSFLSSIHLIFLHFYLCTWLSPYKHVQGAKLLVFMWIQVFFLVLAISNLCPFNYVHTC